MSRLVREGGPLRQGCSAADPSIAHLDGVSFQAQAEEQSQSTNIPRPCGNRAFQVEKATLRKLPSGHTHDEIEAGVKSPTSPSVTTVNASPRPESICSDPVSAESNDCHDSSREVRAWQRFCAGWMAGGTSEMLFGHPLSTVQAHVRNNSARQLLRPSLRGLFFREVSSGAPGSFFNLSETTRLLWRRDGIAGLYRGATLPVFASSLVGATAFASYGFLRHRLQDDLGLGHRISTTLAGASSGAVASIALAPMELLTHRLQVAGSFQVAPGADWSERLALRATLALRGVPLLPAELVLQRTRWRALWAAGAPTSLRDAFCLAGYYSTYEEAKSILLGFEAPPLVISLLGGGVAGAAGAVFAHPFHVLVGVRHVELERKMHGKPVVPASSLEIMRSTLRGGPRRVFKGIHLALLRAVPLNAIFFVVFDAYLQLASRCP